MSSEVSLFSEFNATIEAPQQTAFDWDTTFAETKELVKEDAELTSTIDDAMIRRFEVRVKIGFNLTALQADHSRKGGGIGDFTTIELPKLGITDRTFAHRCIRVAKLYQSTNVASLQHSDFFDRPLPMSTWNQLAAPSTDPVVVAQVMSGETEATPQAIKEANQALLDAKQKLEATQKELEAFKEHAKLRERNREEIHVSQILAFKESEDQLKREKEEAEKQLKSLQEKTAHGSMSPETKEQLDKLQVEIKERTQQRDNLAKRREQLSKELDEQRDVNKARHEQEMYEHRINDRVKKITEEWGKCSVSLLGQLPSPIESQVVTGSNWALIDHAVDMAKRIVDAILQLKTSKDTAFLESEVPYAD